MKGLYRVARRAILTQLKRDPGVTAIVQPTQIHGQAPGVVAWPFITLGPPQVLPIKATCVDGGAVNTPISGFAKSRMSGNVKVETAEDHASRLGAAIERALDDSGENILVDGKPARVTHRLADMRLLMDGQEPDAFHYSATVRTRIIAR